MTILILRYNFISAFYLLFGGAQVVHKRHKEHGIMGVVVIIIRQPPLLMKISVTQAEMFK